MTRFVAPAGERVELDGEGFLFHDEEPWWQPPKPVIRSLEDLVANDDSYVLLAAGGAGKTTAFKWLSTRESDARYINLGSRSRGQQEREVAQAVETGGPVYLDGLDQAANADPQLFPWLEEELTTPAARRIRWRLACRSAAWKSSLSSKLREAFPSFTDLTLLPMDRATASRAFGAEFVDAIAEAGMGRLSASPRQLSSTAAYWNKTGELPVGQLEAIGYEIEKFLEETDEHRSPRLPAERGLRIAKRLAAFTTFGGANLFSTGPTVIDRAIAVHALPAAPEPDEPSSPIEPHDYREVLDTTLFEAGQPGTVLFRHQQYEEYLAASYLVDRKIAPTQMPALLGVHANGALPTARIGITAWLAALNPELVQDLIADNALLLASASLELASDSVKAAVVAALLEDAARDERRPAWRVDLRTLSHPELAEQLEFRLSQGAATSEEVWWIARLAEAGGCRRLSPALADLALNPIWFPYARRAAIAAVRELDDEKALLALRALLQREQDEDPDNEVLAAVVDALYPQFVSTDELTGGLRPGKSVSLGSYRITLRDLADKILSEDLPSFARWLSARPDEDEMLDDLTIGVMRRIWPLADADDPRKALATLIIAVSRSDGWHSQRFSQTDIPWAAEDSIDRRRELALAVADLSEDDWYIAIVSGLLRTSDVHWLLDTLVSLGGRAATTLGKCLTQLLHAPSADLAERILTLPETHPAYEITSWWRESKAVDSPDVARTRERAADRHRHSQALLAAGDRIRDELNTLLLNLSSEPELWWQAALLLGREANGNYSRGTDHDFTAQPGWTILTESQHQQFLEAGIRYLQVHEPTVTTWRGAKRISEKPPSWSAEFDDWAGRALVDGDVDA
ncbi:hypothetical protein AB0G02_26400, partial [Actinosynnema sp. NPDC023658]|uniref:NACHT domain-containing protein n=1 Tax=Actinosynnema sp. NPDC023658 TaxID=3155465 RepID=UPI0033C6A88C